MAVPWSVIEPYVAGAYEQQGHVERADVIDLAYADNADDDVIDVIDAIGSRVFNTPEDVRAFLAGQNLIQA
jgi:phage gp29-like protein